MATFGKVDDKLDALRSDVMNGFDAACASVEAVRLTLATADQRDYTALDDKLGKVDGRISTLMAMMITTLVAVVLGIATAVLHK